MPSSLQLTPLKGITTMPPNATTLLTRLLEEAEARPDALAYAFLPEIGDECIKITYGELVMRARAAAASLAGDLAVDDDGAARVILLFPAGIEFMIAFFACLMAGAIAVPVPMVSPKRSQEALANVASNAQARIVITSRGNAMKAQACLASTLMLASLRLTTIEDLEEAGCGDSFSLPAPQAIALLQYTSGSTGAPKGVIIRHESLAANLQMICDARGLGANQTGVSWLPHFHDMGLVLGLLQSLYVGSETWFMSPASFVKRPLRWLQLISGKNNVIAGGPNFTYHLCSTRIAADAEAGLDLSSWHSAYNGAERVRDETLRTFHERFAKVGFQRSSFRSCYGMAEATLLASVTKAKQQPRILNLDREKYERGVVCIVAPELPGQAIVSCGPPPQGQKTAIVNPVTCAKCPDGIIGEVWLAGPHLAQGYWRRPTESAAVFGSRVAQSDDAAAYFRTGDLGFFLDGEIFIVGRLKEIIIVAGRNIYPDDVESKMLPCHESLQDVAVLSIEMNDSREVLIAMASIGGAERRLFFDSTDTTALLMIARAMQESITHHFDVALDHIWFVGPGEIPKTTSGKTRYSEIRSRFREWPASARTSIMTGMHAVLPSVSEALSS
jgi:acyl-CoA synthetase (AMP-forming)/AMP-acid ligase II